MKACMFRLGFLFISIVLLVLYQIVMNINIETEVHVVST